MAFLISSKYIPFRASAQISQIWKNSLTYSSFKMGPSLKSQQQLDPMTGELQGSKDIDVS